MESRQDRRKFMKLTAAAGGAIALGGLTSPVNAQTGTTDSQELDFFDVVRNRLASVFAQRFESGHGKKWTPAFAVTAKPFAGNLLLLALGRSHQSLD